VRAHPDGNGTILRTLVPIFPICATGQFGPDPFLSAPWRFVPANSGAAVQPKVRLRLIATSDLHACLLPYDYRGDRALSGRSLTEIASLIEGARSEAQNCVLLDNGDFLQGSPLADYVASAPKRRRMHPVIQAFNTLGYDAITLGNHEFDYGLEFLTSSLAGARFPVVSANVTTRLGKSPARDRTLVPPYAILRRTVVDQDGRSHRIRIGVIGFAPPQIDVWDRDNLAGKIRMRDIIASAKAWLPRLRAQGADVIVALAHSGIGPVKAFDGMEDAATALAALPEIDAVIAGHSHLTFPGPGIAPTEDIDPDRGFLAGKPAVMPGHSGSHLGVIDLTLTRRDFGGRRWIVTSADVQLGSTAAKTPQLARSLRQAITPDHRATIAWSRRIVGHTEGQLSTYFATSAPNAAMQLIAQAKADYARRALAGSRWADLPVLSSAAPFRSGGRGGPDNFTDIAQGALCVRHLSDLYAYPNKLVVLRLNGAGIADWLEQSAALFQTVVPGALDAPLHDTEVPSFTFDLIPELAFAIDVSQPARFNAEGRMINPHARRIVGLSLNGRPMDRDQDVLLVTNNHRVNRGLANGSIDPSAVVLAEGMLARSALAEYFGRKPAMDPVPNRNWRFLPMPGTSVRIATGPKAETHLQDIAQYRPERIGTDAEGFLHLRLHL
jgi:2',3'-cyclic-nucleotide 2'-phosphodiesterase / 3'-nucleotidase